MCLKRTNAFTKHVRQDVHFFFMKERRKCRQGAKILIVKIMCHDKRIINFFFIGLNVWISLDLPHFSLRYKQPRGKWPPGPGNDKAGWDYHQLGESNRMHMAKDTRKWKVSFILVFIAPNYTKIMTYVQHFAVVSQQSLNKQNWKLNYQIVVAISTKSTIKPCSKHVTFLYFGNTRYNLLCCKLATEEVNSVK